MADEIGYMTTKENISISLSENSSGNLAEIRVDGVVDTVTAGELESVIDSIIKRSKYRILIDLAGVDYISSAGWGIFISRIKDIRAHQGDIKLANMVPHVLEIYELLEFDKVLLAYNSLAVARESFGAHKATSESKKKLTD